MAKILGIVVVVVLAAGGYLFYTHDYFNKPSIEDIRNFYITDVPDYKEDNALIAAIGLSAPINEVDSYSWALDIVQQGQVLYSDDFQNLFGTIHFQAEWDGLDCWLSSDAPADKPCYTAQQVAELVDYNHILLERFESLSSYPNFVIPPQSQGFYFRDFLNGEKLFLANLIANPGNNQEENLQRWMANNRMLKNAMTDYNNWVTRAILVVTYNMSLNQLQVVLNGNKELAAKYKNQLQELLSDFSTDKMNITYVVKADYLMYGPICTRLGTYCEEKTYQLNQDLIALANVPGPKFADEHAKFLKKYPQDPSVKEPEFEQLPELIKTLSAEKVTKIMLSGIAGVSSMIETLRAADARARILNLYVEALALGMNHDQAMALVNNAPAHLQDPFTGKPFIYNPEDGTLSFGWSNCKEATNCSIHFN